MFNVAANLRPSNAVESMSRGYEFGSAMADRKAQRQSYLYEFQRKKKADQAIEDFHLSEPGTPEHENALRRRRVYDQEGLAAEQQQAIAQAREQRAVAGEAREVESHQADVRSNQIEQQQNLAATMIGHLDRMDKMNDEDLLPYFERHAPSLEQLEPSLKEGFDRVRSDGVITREELQTLRNGLLQAPKTSKGARFSKGSGAIVASGDGHSFAVPVMDNRTGQVTVQQASINGAPVNRQTGETGNETTDRLIRQAGGSQAAKERAEIDAIASKAAETGTAEFHNNNVDEGLTQADNMMVVSRSIELLDSVATGGFDGASLKAKNIFGFESADEAELSTNLLRSVLSQLRPTFGAQFTQAEGERLERIEAGIGKSTEGNRRILGQIQRMIRRAAERGIDSAEEQGRFAEADQIRTAMEARFDDAPGSDGGDLTPEEQAELAQLRAEFGGG